MSNAIRQQSVQRSQVERLNRLPQQALTATVCGQGRPQCAIGGGPARHDHSDGCISQPREGKAQDTSRRRIQPLLVIYG
ncbi:MAG TPA: hypothetical protein VGG07_13310, partial [Solirubrobacteraceae bacterium]